MRLRAAQRKEVFSASVAQPSASELAKRSAHRNVQDERATTTRLTASPTAPAGANPLLPPTPLPSPHAGTTRGRSPRGEPRGCYPLGWPGIGRDVCALRDRQLTVAAYVSTPRPPLLARTSATCMCSACAFCLRLCSQRRPFVLCQAARHARRASSAASLCFFGFHAPLAIIAA